MNKAILDNIEKLGHIMRVADTLYLARNEDLHDHAKRTLLRYLFVQIDNLEKLSGRLKNQLYDAGYLSKVLREEVEDSITHLLSSYNKSFDIIRDKMAAHVQPMDLKTCLDWWTAVDYTVIEVLYDDIRRLGFAFRKSNPVSWHPIGGDYAQIGEFNSTPLGSADTQVRFAADRTALARENSVALVTGNSALENVTQLAVTAVDVILSDFWITSAADNPGTIYKKYLFDISWWMAITDLCSLIDVLFEDGKWGKSVLSVWQAEAIKGASVLNTAKLQRELKFEIELRKIRNRLSAHLDQNSSIHTLYAEYETIDLAATYTYSLELMQEFQKACTIDKRTSQFAKHGTVIKGLLAKRKPSAFK